MENRKYDFVIYGASGFTGQFVVDEVAAIAEEEKLTWAIAGRSMEKLQKVLSESSSRTGKNVDETAIIIADSSSPDSLLEMAKSAKLILNCVGPYRFYGEPVVRACVEAGTHHLDISGEPQFLEKMQLLYHAKAKENNALIIGSVGFDSIPAEMGIRYTHQQFGEGELTNVESYFKNQSGPEGLAINTGTLESAIHGIAHWKELSSLRKSLYPEPMPKYPYRLPKRSVLHFSQDANCWCLPFLGSDKSIVYRTVRDHLVSGKLENPIEFVPYVCAKSLMKAIGMMVFGLILGVMSNFSCGRSLLMKFPHIFSFGYFKKGGPSKKQIEETSFSMTFYGQGYSTADKDRAGTKPDKKVVTKITAPEPGYVTTPICMVQAGVTVLKSQSKMLHKSGVITPGAAFWDTDLIQRLGKRGVVFSTVSGGSTTTKDE